MSFSVRVFLSNKVDAGDGQTRLTFSGDYADNANKAWAKYTPVYEQNMTVLNEVAEGLNIGEKFEGVFTKLPKN